MALDLIAPEIPDAQRNQGPALFLQGLGQGLQAMSRFAEMKRQSESEMLRIAAQERMAQDEHQLGMQKLELETDIRGREMQLKEDMMPSMKMYYESVASTRKKAVETGIEFNLQLQDHVNDVNSQAVKLKLDDPSFATNEPVQFAANVNQFEDMFRFSTLPQVQHTIKEYRRMADQQKLMLKPAEGADPKSVPIWQIVKNLQDPETKEQTVKMLKTNGYYSEQIKKTPGVPTTFPKDKFSLEPKRRFNAAWDAIIGPTEKKEVVDEPTPEFGQILGKGKGVKFERAPSRVPPALLPKSAAKGTSPTEMPDPDLPIIEDGGGMDGGSGGDSYGGPPKFDTTDTDALLGMARDAIKRGANYSAVVQKLQQEYNIDPAGLWG